ncbi:MAG: class I SAM-dependent methyltransferase [Anaerolineales bacterium]|nr:class I SAM-dependent methyltransferase [Anaerolineales bacterium]
MMRSLLRWTTRVYDQLSPIYDWMDRWIFSTGARGREAVLHDLPAGIALDVGCGTGTLIQTAEGSACRWIGIDLSVGMLEQARRKLANTSLVCADFYRLPFPDRAFDAVVETNAFSAVEIEPGAALAEMIRVCRPGGEIRLTDYAPSPQQAINRLEGWFWSLGGDFPHDYHQILIDLGYRVERRALAGSKYQYFRVKL